MQKLHYSIKINAPKEKVYKIMLDDKTYREWTSIFQEGGYYEGSWDKGSDIKFIGLEEDGKKSGMIGVIEENKTAEFVSIKYTGIIDKGIEDTSSETIKKWGNAHENYSFSEENGMTSLKVDLDSDDKYAEMFNDMWPKALEKLKELCESVKV